MKDIASTTTTKTFALSTALLLTLAACGDNGDSEATGNGTNENSNNDDESSDSVVYEFTGETVSGETEIRFEVPEQLIELDQQVSEEAGVDSYIDTRAITAVTARAAEGQDCTIELEYEFDEGAVAEIEENEWEEPADSADDLIDIDMRYAIAAGAGARSQPDGTIMRSGTEQRSQTEYLIDLDCASAPDDDASTFDLRFNKMRDSRFIYAEIAIMSDGTLSIVDEGTLTDFSGDEDLYILDSNGSWIENPDARTETGVEEDGIDDGVEDDADDLDPEEEDPGAR